MNVFLRYPTVVFDYLQHCFETRRAKRLIAALLSLAFVLALGLIECKRLGMLPNSLAAYVPGNHFKAISLGFLLLLGFETLDLVFAVPASVSRSVGKQIEVLSLILLRNTFKELAHFDVPAEISHSVPGVAEIVANASAAILLFVVLGLFYRLRPKPCPMCEDDKLEFISLKKIVALVIFVIFAVIVGFYTMSPYLKFDIGEIFQAFFTCLIFSDILLVLVSLRYLPVYHALFRNSAFAVATLLIRLALVAPPFYGAAISAVAGLLVLAIAWSYGKFVHGFESFVA